jgi:putative transposase
MAMGRLYRIDIPGVPQHLVTRGHDRDPCFHRDLDRAVYLKYLREEAAKSESDIHAFVLMSNHVHLLATGNRKGSLSKLMQHTGRRYCRYVNRAYGRTGTLFESRFHNSLVDSADYFMNCMVYIELNPVRAGMVSTPWEHVWSSHRDNASGEPGGMLTPHKLYLSLGPDTSSRAEAYRRLVLQPLGDECLNSIRQAIAKSAVLGGEIFQKAVEETLQQPVILKPRGRPRKTKK